MFYTVCLRLSGHETFGIMAAIQQPNSIVIFEKVPTGDKVEKYSSSISIKTIKFEFDLINFDDFREIFFIFFNCWGQGP